MRIKELNLDGKMLRAKVPIPFVEENNICLPPTIYVEGYFPAGTVFQFQRPVCSKKTNAYGEQVNDYCHAAALVYNNKLNGAGEDEPEYEVTFHVDLSTMFLLLDLLDASGNAVEL